MNNSKILRIKTAKFSRYYFYDEPKQICISVPLNYHLNLLRDFKFRNQDEPPWEQMLQQQPNYEEKMKMIRNKHNRK